MFYILLELFIGAVIIVPIFLLLWKIKFHNFQQTVRYTVFAVYLSAVYYLVGLPTVQFATLEVNLNLIPFVGMIEDLKNEILNIVLFIPLGTLLPLLWEKYRSMMNTLCFGLGMTIAVELLQIFTYRATDINDVITNFLGTLIGYLIFKVLFKKAPNGHRTSDISLIFAVVCVVMFLVQPYIMSAIYSLI